MLSYWSFCNPSKIYLTHAWYLNYQTQRNLINILGVKTKRNQSLAFSVAVPLNRLSHLDLTLQFQRQWLIHHSLRTFLPSKAGQGLPHRDRS